MAHKALSGKEDFRKEEFRVSFRRFEAEMDKNEQTYPRDAQGAHSQSRQPVVANKGYAAFRL